ncbi:hypothetical protein, variant 2 [Aphanomyces astaci]|nr:hypothetical protein, variant 1 [Aphanomyces astaci]XP_009830227.1 hypothetical protein, variant 2 [Aphanomyces astaci]ETV80302.1 hypothetical protein, variant 1 [Aphanomyces astaci]ETV80303.1 hypothetical protein, variant 2 [Aphanomyces astaci]|eukprot:XP_009830226.1 hypothetical protein, variant 1 [Aphanomyces astaci]
MLGLAYLSFTVCSFGASYGPLAFGEKASMVASSLSYSLYGLVNLIVALYPTYTRLHWYLMVPLSVLSGVSSSVIWISQASYLTALSGHYAQLQHLVSPGSALGLFNGIFFAGYNASQIAGNLISFAVLGALQWPTTALFAVYMVLSLLGSFLLTLLPKVVAATQDTTNDVTTQVETSKLLKPDYSFAPSKSFNALWLVACDRRMVLLGPVMIFHGLQQGFVTGEFTAHVIRESLGSASIGIVMAVYGVVNVMSAFAFGKIADRFGPMGPLLFGLAVVFVAYCTWLVHPIARCDGQWMVVVATAILLSLADSSSTAMLNVILGQEFPANSVHAFSVFRVYHAGSTSASFLTFRFLSLQGRLATMMAVVVVASATFVLFCLRYRTPAKQLAHGRV